MEEYKIVLPCESEEEIELKSVVKSVDGVEFNTGNIKNLDGASMGEIIGLLVPLIQLASSLLTLSNSILDRKVTVYGENNKVIRRNIKIRDLKSFLQNLNK